jgi:hypothetical protein
VILCSHAPLLSKPFKSDLTTTRFYVYKYLCLYCVSKKIILWTLVPTPYSGAASDFVLPCSPFIRTIQITSNDDVFFYSEAIPPPSKNFVKTPSSVPLFPSPAPTIPDLIPMTTGTGESTRSISTRWRSPPPRTASSPPLSLETALHLRAPLR